MVVIQEYDKQTSNHIKQKPMRIMNKENHINNKNYYFNIKCALGHVI